MKRTASIVFALTLAAGALVGCSKDKASDTATGTTAAAADSLAADSLAAETSPAETAAGTAAAAPDTAAAAIPETAAAAGGKLKGKTVVYLINGALGDKGFYDSGQAGLKKMEATYGVKTRTLEANFDAAKYQALVDAAFEEGDVIFAIAYGFEDPLKAAAKAHPDKQVINVDFDIKDTHGHVTSIDFVEEQSAFLAGALAALATSDTAITGMNPEKVIGVVGGDNDPVTSSFLFAYENGAKSIDPSVKVDRKFLGGAWDDQAKGKQAAEQLYDGGADIVFQVAAAAGLGVLQAAKDRNLFAIGVDANQNDLQPGHVIASDIKNVGDSMVKVAATIDDGTYVGGAVLTYGLAEGGVDLDLKASTQVLPPALADRIAALRADIVSGAVKVERYKG